MKREDVDSIFTFRILTEAPSLKRAAWGYAMAKKGSRDEATLLAHLRRLLLGADGHLAGGRGRVVHHLRTDPSGRAIPHCGGKAVWFSGHRRPTLAEDWSSVTCGSCQIRYGPTRRRDPVTDRIVWGPTKPADQEAVPGVSRP